MRWVTAEGRPEAECSILGAVIFLNFADSDLLVGGAADWQPDTMSVVFLAMLAAAGAVEPWTDARLPVTAGLEGWWDASRQNAAREAAGLPALSAASAVDRLLDGSGHGRDLVASAKSRAPALRQIGDGKTLHFDGANNALDAETRTPWRPDSTVCLVAAPQSNRGQHRALLSLGGMTLTLGEPSSSRLDTLTVQGDSIANRPNLIKDGFELGTFHTFCVDGGRLFIDGQAHGQAGSPQASVSPARWWLGARDGKGFFDGDVAEVIIYGRKLSDQERIKVERYLVGKHVGLSKAAGIDVQVLVPGFTVRPLPLALPNITNVRYRPDGTLVAVGYDGKIYLLTDTDGDGLEDRVRIFWDDLKARGSLGAALTPPGYARGQGVFVAANRKLSLVLDRDGDDKADEETVVATSTTDSRGSVENRPVGAVGVAIDATGKIYFGQGAASYTNGYLVDPATKKSLYDLHDQRGVILEVAPDFTRQRIVSTGVRYPVGLAFNKAGDLFATDQEGATWLPNGNPFDELLHIQTGRHYGFPPRHPTHLPDVVDEPSVFDYAPQHHSTCGFVFDEGRTTFGPAWWQGDAFVTGFSRGKLFRTKLVKTAAGYVAQNQIFASLGMLPTDVTLSPAGDLLVTAHSGRPDWGSGPHGIGKLYKITYAGKDEAQPAVVYAASATQTHVLFDRPVTPRAVRARIVGGPFVGAGDRFEVWRPGYAVVKMQEQAPRSDLPVSKTTLSSDGRTLVIEHGARTDAGRRYALALEGLRERVKSGVPQQPEIDLDHDLGGVEARFTPRKGAPKGALWTGWLPSLDLGTSLALTAPSADHAQLRERLRRPGTLTLRAQLDLGSMLRPAVQPGSKIDYELPPEQVTIVVSGSGSVTLRAGGAAVSRRGSRQASLTVNAPQRPVPVEITLATGTGEAHLQVVWHTKEDARARALPLRRTVLPWAVPGSQTLLAETNRQLPELRGGDWTRGKALFFGPEAACSRCHQMRGEGARVGPDLSNLVFRDYDSVLRDIREPSAALNPDHLQQTVQLADGQVVNGIVQENRTDDIVLVDASGTPTTVPRSRIVSMKASDVSLMPQGVDQALGPERLRDLLTFLLTPPPRAAALGR